MITIRDLAKWAEENGMLDVPVIQLHGKDFEEEPFGKMDYQKIGGETVFIEWFDEATAKLYEIEYNKEN